MRLAGFVAGVIFASVLVFAVNDGPPPPWAYGFPSTTTAPPASAPGPPAAAPDATPRQVPGSSGQFQMLNNHAPIISTLVNGKVNVKTEKETLSFDVKGGVVEMLNNKVMLLAESV